MPRRACGCRLGISCHSEELAQEHKQGNPKHVRVVSHRVLSDIETTFHLGISLYQHVGDD